MIEARSPTDRALAESPTVLTGPAIAVSAIQQPQTLHDYDSFPLLSPDGVKLSAITAH